MKLLLVIAATAGAPGDQEAFIAAYVARHRDEVCGTHWVGNPTHAQCIAMLQREASRLYNEARR